jgi:hypothetical protein
VAVAEEVVGAQEEAAVAPMDILRMRKTNQTFVVGLLSNILYRYNQQVRFYHIRSLSLDLLHRYTPVDILNNRL